MFKRLYFKIASIIFVSCAVILGITSTLAHVRSVKYIDSTIDRHLDSVLSIDINAAPSSLKQFSDTTVFLYFPNSTEPYTEQKLYDEYTYQKIFEVILSKNRYKGKVHIDKYYLAYRGVDVFYYDGSSYTISLEYIVYDYTDLQNYSTNLIKKVNLSGIVAICLFVALSLFLSYWFTKPLKKSHEREKRLLADASHELKTPVAIIMSDLDVLNNNRNEKIESKQDFIDSMYKQTERMKYMIQTILDYSKIGTQIFEKEEFDLSNMINEVILTLESYAFENSILFETNISPDIHYTGEKNNISVLVYTLIDNAIKYNRKNGHIYVNLFKKNRHIVLEIKNNGHSIAPEDIDRVFDRFYKVDKSRKQDNQKSFGLGLSIAKSIVDNHKGKIKVESVKDLTTFTVIL